MIERMFSSPADSQKLVIHSGQFCLHLIVRKLRAEGTSAFREKVPGTADMYSISSFLSTLPGYFLGQDSQPSTTSHRQKLTTQDAQSCSVRHMDGFQHQIPV